MAAPSRKCREATFEKRSRGGPAGKPPRLALEKLALGTPPPILGGERGAATVYFVLFTHVALGLLVMATDFGRMYLIQGELQTAADAAALAAAMQLAGTTNALTHAANQVTASFDSTTGNDNRFNLRQNQIGIPAGLTASTEVTYFATLEDALANINGGQSGPVDWSSGLYPKYARVQITAQAPVLFAPLLNRAVDLPTIAASSVAGISVPMCSVCGIEGLAIVDPSAGADPVNYGLVPGGFYTLYLTTTQQTPNAPVTPGPLEGTAAAVPYAILNHVPSGNPDLDLDGLMFEMGAAGIARTNSITAETPEVAYELEGNTAPIGQDILCGLNSRFGVDPSENVCATLNNGEFTELAPFFTTDTDPGTDEYTAGLGLEDFATEYDGSARRVLTMAVVDDIDALNVLNFRQFLIEMSPTVIQGLNPVASGAFRAQYIGALVPLRCGGIGGVCTISNGGVGRTVLH